MTSLNKTKGLVYIFTGDGKGKTSAALGVAVRAVCAGKRVVIVQWYKTSGKRKAESGKLKKQNTIRPSWVIAENNLPDYFPNLEIYPMGAGFHLLHASCPSVMSSGSNDFTLRASVKTAPLRGGGVVVDTASEEEHRRAAKRALHLAKELLLSNGLWVVGNGEGMGSEEGLHKMNPNASSSQPSSKLKTQNSKLFLLILDEVINAVNDGLLVLPDLLALLELRGSTHLILTGRGAPKELINLADLVTEMKNVKHPYEKGLKAVKGLDF